jgi:hypothetical protein
MDRYPECLDPDIRTGGALGDFDSSNSDMPFIDGVIHSAKKYGKVVLL